MNDVLFSSGTIGFFHDWHIGQYPEMIYNYAANGLYIWDSQVGNLVYPVDWLFRTILIPFSFLGGELISKGLIIFFITFSGISAFCLGKQLKLNFVASFAAGLIYVFSPIIFTRVIAGHSYYLLAYLLAPLVILVFLKAREENKRILFIASGLVLSLALVQIHFLIMLPFVLLIFSITDRGHIKKSMLGLGIILSVSFLVLLSPVVLSQFMVKTTTFHFNPVQLLSTLQSFPASDLSKSFRLLGYELQPYSYVNLGTSDDYYSTDNNVPKLIFYLDFLVPVVGFSALLFRRDKYTVPLAIISIVGLFILKGSNPPFGDVFSSLFINGLFIFREIWHISFLYAFSITFLCAFFFDSVMAYFSRNQFGDFKGLLSKFLKLAVPVFLMSIIALANGFPLLTGNFAGYVQTYSLPESYRDVYNSYSNNIVNFNTLILPLFSPMRYDGLKLVGIDPHIRYSDGSILPTTIIPGYTPSQTAAISGWLLSVMHGNHTNYIGKILSGLGIKYIIVRDDFTDQFSNFTYNDRHIRSEWGEPVDRFLKVQEDLVLIKDTKNYKIYKNTVDSSKFFIPIYSVGSSLFDFNQLLFLANMSSLADFEIYPSSNPVENNENDTMASFYYTPHRTNVARDNANFIELGKYATSIYASTGWTTNRDWFAYDHLLASRLHKGLFTVAHEAETEVNLPASIHNGKPIEIFLKAVKWIKGGSVVVNVNGISSHLNLYSLDSKLGIFKIFDDSIPSDSQIKISILSEDGGNYIEGLYIADKKTNNNGISNLKVRSSNNSSVIGMENYIYQVIDYNLNRNPSFSMANSSGGDLPVFWTDGYNICRTAFDCVSDFTTGWKDNSSLRISSKENKIMDNEGNNTIIWSGVLGNETSVKPDEKYEVVTHMKLNEKAAKSHIVLEGYNNRSNTWYQIAQCPGGIDGPLALEWNMFRCQVTIPGDTIKARFVLNAGQSSASFLEGQAITWFDEIYMLKTRTFDSPLYNQQNLNSVLDKETSRKHGPNGIVNYKEINPTLWHAKISNFTMPFTLAFAEPYDEGWLAEIYNNGKIIGTKKSIPLYGSINAFHIDNAGIDLDHNLSVIVRYEPQYWFEIGLLISFITAGVCIVILILNKRISRKMKRLRSAPP